MDKPWESLRIWQDRKLQNEEGQVVFCFGLATTIYFFHGYKREKRHACLDCFNDYDRLCGSSLNWYYAGHNPSRMSRVSKLRSRDMSPLLLSNKWEAEEAKDFDWEFFWHGGRSWNDASPYGIRAYGISRTESEVENSLSYIQASFPVLFFQERPECFSDLVISWSSKLKAHHGYGGITLLTSPDPEVVEEYSGDIGGIAARFPGIEIEDPVAHSLLTQEAIKGVNWLTVISDYFVQRLGGVDILTVHLGSPFEIVRYQTGVVVLAGTCPETGDKNRNQEAPLYRKLAHELTSIRLRSHPALFDDGLLSDEEEVERWLGRFDR